MRLTADLLQSSLSYLNPLKERELDLRGHKIPTIENLGIAGPQDSIDFTDNDITSLSSFPLSPRLSTLLCARNRITTIDKRIAEALPNLTTLVLTQNAVRELGDLEGLRGCQKLAHLSLRDNPVEKKEYYRLYLIHLIPSLRFLDFQRITQVEREKSTELFGTHAEPSALANKIKGAKSNTFDVGSAVSTSNGERREGAIRTQLSRTEKERVQRMLKEARTFQEISRIEKDLKEGRVPRGAGDHEN